MNQKQIPEDNNMRGSTMENEKELLEKAITKEKMFIICSGIISVLLVFLELYVILTNPGSIVVIAAIAIVFVVVLFVLLNSVINLSQATKKLDRMDYEELSRAQKASYLVIKKNFEELQERMLDLEDGTNFPIDEIIKAQKSVAKVTISRSKENTDALMNSNEVLANQIFGFKDIIKDANGGLVQEQQRMIDDLHRDLDAKTTELNRRFDTLSQSMMQVQNSISLLEQTQRSLSMQQPVMMAVQAMQQPPVAGQAMPAAPIQQPVSAPAVEPIPEPAAPETPIASEMTAEPETSVATEMPDLSVTGTEMTDLSDQIPDDQPQIPVDEPLPDFDEAIGSDEAPLLIDEDPLNLESAPEAEEADLDLEAVSINLEEAPLDLEAAPFDLEETPLDLEAAPIEEPAPVEETPAAADLPDLSSLLDAENADPNKQLSPDEIAAMFAAAPASPPD